MKTTTDFLGYTVIANGIDAGRYATAEVAMQSYYDEQHGVISDLSKDVMGFRDRHDYSECSFAELNEVLEYYSKALDLDGEEERRREEEALKAFMQYAPDEETARRWLQQ
jgi:hypothetical protein